MNSLLLSLYCLLLLTFITGAGFVVYHLLRYSLNKALGIMGSVLFIVVFVFFLLGNISAYQALNTKELLKKIDRGALFPESKFAPPVAKKSPSNPW